MILHNRLNKVLLWQVVEFS